jgi:hypothetical protein
MTCTAAGGTNTLVKISADDHGGSSHSDNKQGKHESKRH